MEYNNLWFPKINKTIQADIVVCGGGPAGIGAAISASRNGAKVVLVEKQNYLGGAATANGVSTFAYGYHDKERFIIGGIFMEIREKLYQRDALIKTKRVGWEPFNPLEYKILLDEIIASEDINVINNLFICDLIKKDEEICSLIAAGKDGFYSVSGKIFIDATGDGDIAALEGNPFDIGREGDNAVQPMTQMYYIGGVDEKKAGECQKRGYWKDDKGRGYLNGTGFYQYIEEAVKKNEWTLPYKGICSVFTIPWMKGIVGINFGRVEKCNGLYPMSITKAAREGRKQVKKGMEFLRKYVPGFENAYIVSMAPEIGVRETRRIRGSYILKEEDILTQKQFPDVIAQNCYMIDVHSPDKGVTLIKKLPKGTHYDIPYGCLVPKKSKNMFMAGRCISATQSALGSVRVQPVCMALGEAAGAAAALCLKYDTAPRQLDVSKLQEVLLRQGAILK